LFVLQKNCGEGVISNPYAKSVKKNKFRDIFLKGKRKMKREKRKEEQISIVALGNCTGLFFSF
jgi:hypothetical protein